MASTPPPPSPSALRVPRAPRHGPKHDDYEPYVTRYSTRLASQRASRADKTTPPPSHSSASTRPGTSKRTLSPSSPGTAKPSPKKAARPNRNAASRISPFDMELSLPRTSAHHTSRSSAERALPTPAKTPSKKKVISSGTSTSRSLFPSTSTPKRRKMEASKRSTHVPHGIYADEPEGTHALHNGKQDSISIHEDSRDRIPIVSKSVDDPFVSKPAASAHRHATRSKIPCNQEGVWYFQRGKKVFRRFDDIEDEGEDEDDLGLFANRPDLLADNPDVLKDVKPLKRSELKPRVLFRVPDEQANTEEDVTDIEDNEPMSPTLACQRLPAEGWVGSTWRANLTPPVVAQQPPVHGTEEDPFTPLEFRRPVLRPGVHFATAPEYDYFDDSSLEATPRAQPPTTLGLSSSDGTIRKYWSTSVKARAVETRSERMKRHRDSRGSPAPRTRQAARNEASAEASAAQVPIADATTADI
ncbi:hypothetical protein N7457_000167 [Penicillium paradoxum]|uniref:uncharacterized protein n=1 Tax=Penicillium paradoxum TaxID=176176 RepID=UPI0025494F42|nr:uncharacterized protein N7457_000167 [Penicillium paradoxum]KAJ5793568.1 hypothetical protein N7457_000167 [Penicillium paradoxum]